MWISFAWTTGPLLRGIKTCSRRDWKDRHFANWCKAWDDSRFIHSAWSKVPYAGGRKVADIRLTARPYKEALAAMPEADLDAEGGLWDSKVQFIDLFGGNPSKNVVVVRFVLDKVLPGPYPDNWREVADEIKGQAGNCCEQCGRAHWPLGGYTLTVHHLDGNPANCQYNNLVALCQRCHLAVQSAYLPGQGWMKGMAPRWAVERGLADEN